MPTFAYASAFLMPNMGLTVLAEVEPTLDEPVVTPNLSLSSMTSFTSAYHHLSVVACQYSLTTAQPWTERH